MESGVGAGKNGSWSQELEQGRTDDEIRSWSREEGMKKSRIEAG
jgi:hypothetical protein